MKRIKGTVLIKLDHIELKQAIEMWMQEALDYAIRDATIINMEFDDDESFPISFEITSPTESLKENIDV